jgi:protein-arginine kinase activator protein McsA
MLCDVCHQREALVHLTSTVHIVGLEQAPTAQQEQHFCRECADEYYSRMPGMNSSRDLICLSDWYRSKLYDMLEVEHPEAFDHSTSEACERASELVRVFLRRELAKAGIELNEDGFEMLWIDFNCSHHFYTRADEYRQRNG